VGARLAGATWREAITALQEDSAWRDGLTRELADSPHAAFFWECAPVSAATLDRPFEFVLVESPTLAGVRPEPGPFREHLLDRHGVSTFDNLGGDAVLVAPCADAGLELYPHLATFVRGAPSEQVHALWRAVGFALEERLAESSAPCWVSTSGLGVYWVHVRLDTRPKYYTHAPYRTFRP
jgi:hypothetical protein